MTAIFQLHANGDETASNQNFIQIAEQRGGAGSGDIINVSSIAGIEGYPGGSIYCATKAAVRTFTDALRRELIASSIRVIEVDPGQVETVNRPSKLYVAEELTSGCRSFLWFDLVEIKQRPTRCILAVNS